MEFKIILFLSAVCAGQCVYILWLDHRIEQLEGYINRRGGYE